MINRDQWLEAVREATERPLPPSDALTIKELGELLGVDRFGATRRINAVIALKRAEKTTKSIRRSDGVVVRVTAYRLIQEPADVRRAATRTRHARRRGR